jgi:AcrR family transcriptional regulator
VQARADRTQALVIEETINCVREEGFAAASTRRIIERAGVSWGVIQYHFGDRDRLLAAVIDQGIANLVDRLDAVVEQAAGVKGAHARAELLTSGIWAAFAAPECTATLEILIATRSKRGTLDSADLGGLEGTLLRLSELVGGDSEPRPAIANLLWASAVGMMVAQMANTQPVPTHDEQEALTDIVADLLSPRRRRRPRS